MLINGIEVTVTGRLIRTAKLRAEYFEHVENPEAFVAQLKASKVRADIFCFLQPIGEKMPYFDYHLEADSLSVMPITTYDHWSKKQINGKTRNMLRKAEKCGVEIRVAEFDDEFVRGIQGIYNESPIRQGKPFQHYGKDFETLKRAHATYIEKCQFIGAYAGKDLIGFVKLFHHADGTSSLMQIISKVSSRDKAPTNALIAKAVQICAERGVPRLHYGVWSRRSLGEFKKHHAFERYDIPRYYVPLNIRGYLAIALGLHRKLADEIPGHWQDAIADLRAKWYSWRYRTAAS